jgi:enoyl-[acyl-carrier protein] reductase I
VKSYFDASEFIRIFGEMMSILTLKNKIALVTGVADNLGFGWHIAKALQASGAKVILSCHPRVKSILERFLQKDKYQQDRILPFNKGSFSPIAVIACDVAYDTKTQIPDKLKGEKGYENDVSIEGLFNELKKYSDSLDILVHSIAFTPEANKSHLNTTREAYLTALSASSYSLVALTKASLPFMKGRHGSVIGLSYLASQRAVPFYGGGMASAKAALECDARMLSWFIGEEGHRVNIISAGPYGSRAAKAIGDIDVMIDHVAKHSPLRRPITPHEVANTTLFLCSDLSSAITGEVIFVDAGYHAMGV